MNCCNNEWPNYWAICLKKSHTSQGFSGSISSDFSVNTQSIPYLSEAYSASKLASVLEWFSSTFTVEDCSSTSMSRQMYLYNGRYPSLNIHLIHLLKKSTLIQKKTTAYLFLHFPAGFTLISFYRKGKIYVQNQNY